MITVCASVFLGTIYPLLVEVFSNNKISVGEPYFNSTTIPIMIPAILVMGIGPILSWNKADAMKIFRKSFPSILLTTVISIIFFWIYRPYNILGLVGIILAFWIVSNILLTLVLQLILKNKKFIQDNIPKYSNGMIIAHLGIGLLILGITGSSIWQKEKIIRMKVNDKTEIHNYNIVFKEINKIAGPNYLALQGNFLIYNKKKNIIAELKPENRFYPVANNSTTEASIHTNLLRDLYIVLGEGDTNKGWVVRIYYNPLVIWIWIGAFMIFLGGLFSIKSNLKFTKRLTL
jgi:cytochrome c-type biogenesis protein CcmF